jgi:hypothetical protein
MTALEYRLSELSKKGFFYVTEATYPEFKKIVLEGRKLEREQENKQKSKQVFIGTISLN